MRSVPAAPFTPSPVAVTPPVDADDDEAYSAQVDLVLEMTASSDADGFQRPSAVTRAEVLKAIKDAGGDVSAAVDEVMSLMAIRSLSVQDQERHDQRTNESRLQLSELCTGLGLDECNAFVRALEALPDAEKDNVLSTNGGFIQQLLLAMDEEDAGEEEDEEQHPLAKLVELYPHYRVEVIEDVLEQQRYDVEAAAQALHNLRALDHVQSYATVVSADARAAAVQRDLQLNGPAVDSLGDFPELSSKTQQKKIKRIQRRQYQQLHAPHQSLHQRHQSQQSAAPRFQTPKKTTTTNWQSPTQTPGVLQTYTGTPSVKDNSQVESGLASQLKIDRLQRLLPAVDRNIIQTTFFLNGCSSDATEAALREIFNVPMAERSSSRPQVTAAEVNEADDDDAEFTVVAPRTPARQSRGDWTLVTHRRRVDASRKELSNRYCEMLDSFRRDHHAMAAERVRTLRQARQDLRDAQRQLAHDYFVAHHEQLKRGQPVDLHGLIVMEAIQVLRESLDFCKQHRIRRCVFICGVGHHSVNGRPRILTAVRLSLERRLIDYRELHGVVTVYPLRSPAVT